MIAVAPLLLLALGLLVFFVKKKRDIAVAFLELIMFTAIASLTLLGLKANMEGSSELFANLSQVGWIPFISDWDMWKEGLGGDLRCFIQIVGNILMFAPFGFFYRQLHGKGLKKAWILAFVMPIGIECLQTAFGRVGDANDVICNALGMMFGYYLNACYQFIFHKTSCGEIKLRKGGTVSIYHKAGWVIFCLICVVRILRYPV